MVCSLKTKIRNRKTLSLEKNRPHCYTFVQDDIYISGMPQAATSLQIYKANRD